MNTAGKWFSYTLKPKFFCTSYLSEELVIFDFNQIYSDNNLSIGHFFKWSCTLLNTAHDKEASAFISKWVGLKCERRVFMQLKDGAQSACEIKDLCFLWIKPRDWDPLLNVRALFRPFHLTHVYVSHMSYVYFFDTYVIWVFFSVFKYSWPFVSTGFTSMDSVNCGWKTVFSHAQRCFTNRGSKTVFGLQLIESVDEKGQQ